MRQKSSAVIPIAVFIVVAAYLLFQNFAPHWHHAYAANSIQVWFSPKGGCTEDVVDELNRAKTSVFVQAYSFTSPPIANALVGAMRRGVKVQVILDKSQLEEKNTELPFLAQSSVPTWIDSRHAIAHNKIMIIDGETVLTGSFNFTRQAEDHNAENLIAIHGAKDLAAQYTENWEAHQSHSEPYHDGMRLEGKRRSEERRDEE